MIGVEFVNARRSTRVSRFFADLIRNTQKEGRPT